MGDEFRVEYGERREDGAADKSRELALCLDGILTHQSNRFDVTKWLLSNWAAWVQFPPAYRAAR
eukprot:780869-Prymnesium_polylepis.3